jgi:hypothetical protein
MRLTKFGKAIGKGQGQEAGPTFFSLATVCTVQYSVRDYELHSTNTLCLAAASATEGSEIAMPSWPMIEYRAETWCLLVTHSLSHVGLTLLGIASPTLGSSSSSSRA